MDIKSYNLLHQELADKFQTDTHTINFIRSMASEKSFRRNDLIDWIIEKLKTFKHKTPTRKQLIYTERGKFIGNLKDTEFEYIATYQG